MQVEEKWITTKELSSKSQEVHQIFNLVFGLMYNKSPNILERLPSAITRPDSPDKMPV